MGGEKADKLRTYDNFFLKLPSWPEILSACLKISSNSVFVINPLSFKTSVAANVSFNDPSEI